MEKINAIGCEECKHFKFNKTGDFVVFKDDCGFTEVRELMRCRNCGKIYVYTDYGLRAY